MHFLGTGRRIVSYEQYLLIFPLFIGVLYALIFGQVTNIISQLQKGSNEFTEQLSSIKNFNKVYNMPPKVAKRFEDYVISTWAVTKGTDEEKVFSYSFKFFQTLSSIKTDLEKGRKICKRVLWRATNTLFNLYSSANFATILDPPLDSATDAQIVISA